MRLKFHMKKLVRNILHNPTAMWVWGCVVGEIPPIDSVELFSRPECLRKNFLTNRKVVHMTAPTTIVGRSHYRSLLSFKFRNPDYDFVYWDDSDIDNFLKQFFWDKKIYEVYEKAEFGITRSDIFRLCVIKIHGGLYFDMKSSFTAPLSKLEFMRNKLYLIREPHLDIVPSDILNSNTGGKYVGNWFMGGCVDPPVVEEILNYIVADFHKFDELRARFGLVKAVWETTGPRMLTRFFIEKGFGDDVIIIDEDDSKLKPEYSCRGAWVRKLVYNHYASR